MTREQPPSGGARSNMLPFLIIVVAMTAVFVLLAAGLNPWDTLFINPLTNALLLLDRVVFNQFGLAILMFTLLMRIATIPFTIRQLESTRAMQTIQPQVQEMQKKYKDPKRRQEEMMKLYREHNINPLGCFMPMAIQMVVFIALYRSLVFTVGGSPESLIGLSQRLYPFSFLQSQVPLQQHFLWLNLGRPDTTFALPLIVGVSTYIQQKMSITPNANAQMQQQQQMMSWMMPMMFVFLTLSLPSGVGVYWVASNVFSLVASYYVYGKRVLSWRQLLPGSEAAQGPAARPSKSTEPSPPPGKTRQPIQVANDEGEPPAAAPTAKVRTPHGKRRGKRKNRR
jgi:YidC/Oxa1 family membrane protein insertase